MSHHWPYRQTSPPRHLSPRTEPQYVPYNAYGSTAGHPNVNVSPLGSPQFPVGYDATGYSGSGQSSSGQHDPYTRMPSPAAVQAIEMEDTARRHASKEAHVPVYEMSADPVLSRPSTDNRNAAPLTASSTTDQSVRANPWPYHPEEPRDSTATDQVRKDEDKEPVQAVPWPYHGPGGDAEDDTPSATVHPPVKKSDHQEKLPEQGKTKPLGNDVSVLDDILSSLEIEDDQGDEVEKEPENGLAHESQKLAALRPPPLNLSRPTKAQAEPSDTVLSPGGRTYIPYRPAPSPSDDGQTTTHSHSVSPYARVPAPHHVYLPDVPSALSPPPRPPPSDLPQAGGANQGYSLSSPGQAQQSTFAGSVASPTFAAYEPPMSNSRPGPVSPSLSVSPGFTPYRPISPRPSPSMQAQSAARPAAASLASPTYLGSPVSPMFPSYTSSSSPHALPSPGLGVPIQSSASKPGSPAQSQHHLTPTDPRFPSPNSQTNDRMPSPSAVAPTFRPSSSHNDYSSSHSGVVSNGAPASYGTGHQPRPSPTNASIIGSSSSPYFSPPLSPGHPQQHQTQTPSSSPYHIPQATYAAASATDVSGHPSGSSSYHRPPESPRPPLPQSDTLSPYSTSPTSPPPPYTALDLPPRPGSQPPAGGYYNSNHQPPPHGLPPVQPSFPPQPTYTPPLTNQTPAQHPSYNSHAPDYPRFEPPPLPPRPSTSHSSRPPPPPPRPQGFGSGPQGSVNFPPPPKANYAAPPPMPPRPQPTGYSSYQGHYAGNDSNSLFKSSSAKKWIDKTERLVEQTFGDILQPQVDQHYRPNHGQNSFGRGQPSFAQQGALRPPGQYQYRPRAHTGPNVPDVPARGRERR